MNDSFLTPDVRKESFMTSGLAPDSAGRLPLPGETSAGRAVAPSRGPAAAAAVPATADGPPRGLTPPVVGAAGKIFGVAGENRRRHATNRLYREGSSRC